MNQKQAKKLRRVVYGDHSIRAPRKYKEGGGSKPVVLEGTTVVGYKQIIAVGLRRNYQMSKKIFLGLGKR